MRRQVLQPVLRLENGLIVRDGHGAECTHADQSSAYICMRKHLCYICFSKQCFGPRGPGQGQGLRALRTRGDSNEHHRADPDRSRRHLGAGPRPLQGRASRSSTPASPPSAAPSRTSAAASSDGVLTGGVKVASVDVPVEQLIGHLQGPDFFDAERNPEITFTVDGSAQDGDQLIIKGDLTMRGVTKPLEAVGSLAGPTQYLDGNDRIALELTTVVDRTEFGIDWNAPLPAAARPLGNDVTLTVELQLVKAEA